MINIQDEKGFKNKTISIAIVSGKGGSGKTLIAVSLAQIFRNNGINTTLIDCDFGTGGLTYYLGLNMVANISRGMSDIIHDEQNENEIDKNFYIQKLQDNKHENPGGDILFIGIGDHRKLLSNNIQISSDFLVNMINKINNFGQIIIFDCRGGIDDDSLAVCKAVNDIIIIAETDTTSFQTTYFLTEILSKNGLSSKIRGFFINKAFDDPSSIAKNGTGLFKCQFLSAIPFDLKTTRQFLQGDLPSISSIFSNQVWAGIFKIYGDIITKPKGRILLMSEFKDISLKNIDDKRGSRFLLMTNLYISCGIIYLYWQSSSELKHRFSEYTFLGIDNYVNIVVAVILSLTILNIISTSETIRSTIGRFIYSYIEFFQRFFK